MPSLLKARDGLAQTNGAMTFHMRLFGAKHSAPMEEKDFAWRRIPPHGKGRARGVQAGWNLDRETCRTGAQ